MIAITSTATTHLHHGGSGGFTRLCRCTAWARVLSSGPARQGVVTSRGPYATTGTPSQSRRARAKARATAISAATTQARLVGRSMELVLCTAWASRR